MARENLETDGGIMVSIHGLSKTFGEVPVLRDIRLDVGQGEFVSVIGASGCGKSTLLRIISGLENASEGEVLVNGIPVRKPSRRIGIVFQDHRLLPWLTAEENILLSLDKDVRNPEDTVTENLRLVGLESFRKAYPDQLSGGMAQRVSIARALANHPDILLLDEPFGALDAMTRIHMQQELLRIWRKEKITMILITHDIDEAVYLGQRVVVMSERPGHIKDIFRVRDICHQDRNGQEFVAAKEKIYREFFRENG